MVWNKPPSDLSKVHCPSLSPLFQPSSWHHDTDINYIGCSKFRWLWEVGLNIASVQVGNEKGCISERVFIANVKEKDSEEPERGRRGNAKAVQMLLYGWCCLSLCLFLPLSLVLQLSFPIFHIWLKVWAALPNKHLPRLSSPLASRCLTRVAILGPSIHWHTAPLS